jgi:cytochrome c-type biogenesis protein CcmH
MTMMWLGMAGLMVLAWLMLLPAALRTSPRTPRTALDAPQAMPASRATTSVVALLIGATAVALYAGLGNPGAVTALQNARTSSAADGDPNAEVSRESLEAMIVKLEERLQAAPSNAPSNLEGWKMVARSFAALQRFADADRAYERALALSPDDAQLLADRADVLAMLQGQRAAGEPERLIRKALQIDPNNLKALAMSGSAAFERKDFASAKAQWQRARELAPPSSEFASGLDRSLDEVLSAEAKADVGSKPLSRSETDAPRIMGRVSLSPALAARALPGDTVFVVARAAQGPRMPLAIIRRTVADLPFDFTLDDSLAMSPQMKLSNFARVVLSARVSRSGQALPQPGDLYGETAPADLRAAGGQLSIDRVQP